MAKRATVKTTAKTPTAKQRQSVQRRFHLDRRVPRILADAEGDDDDLLDTPEAAAWLGTSNVWLESGRVQNYGPPFIRLSSRVVRYRRGDVIKWLKSRTKSTAA